MSDIGADAFSGRVWLPSPQVWMKSELLDLDNEQYFGPGSPDYDSTTWPLRKRVGTWRESLLYDASFDWNVRNAWKLPWQFSRTSLERCERRSRANFVIRHVGHWDGDVERYTTVLSPLSRQLRSVASGATRQIFALTPFSIIAQHFRENTGPRGGVEIGLTEILFFYTFDNFVQEALVRNAYAGGVAPDTIASAYEHRYSNTSPGAVLAHDPGDLRLAALTTSDFSWTGIRGHLLPRGLNRMGGVPEDRPLELRERLFQCRTQAHLMVAIAAACHGIMSFQHSAWSSPLVAPLTSAPTIDQLAPFWLRHVLGTYDHADACMLLLDALARRHGHDVSFVNGSIVPGFTGMTTDAEESVAQATSPFGHDDTMPSDDSFRFGIFDTAIDDDALPAWDEAVRRKFVQRRG
jgi:hypothetical protein